jgi:hypothetical protein
VPWASLAAYRGRQRSLGRGGTNPAMTSFHSCALKPTLCRAASGPLAQHVRPRRHRLSIPASRHVMAQRFQSWHEVTGTAAA